MIYCRRLLLVLFAVALLVAAQSQHMRAHAAVGLSDRANIHCLFGKRDTGPIGEHESSSCALCVLGAILDATPEAGRPARVGILTPLAPAKAACLLQHRVAQAHRARASPRVI